MLGTHEFRPLALAEAKAKGLPDLGIVTVPHPIGGIAEDLVAGKARAAVDDVLATLTRASRADGGEAATLEGPASRHRAPDDLLDFQGFMMEQGWGDGLPLIPATTERVAAMLAGTRRPPGDLVAVLPPRLGRATVEQIGVNAVLAGALPEHLPVILAAVEAVGQPAFNL
ncbi:MAG TPA: UGSC family (seleno)protein, partial [Methylomirabilota bacterium]|nr:UGSC family (seleno)protein [Methylomirabilota bacterium]